jgi:hypothetical protein
MCPQDAAQSNVEGRGRFALLAAQTRMEQHHLASTGTAPGANFNAMMVASDVVGPALPH